MISCFYAHFLCNLASCGASNRSLDDETNTHKMTGSPILANYPTTQNNEGHLQKLFFVSLTLVWSACSVAWALFCSIIYCLTFSYCVLIFALQRTRCARAQRETTIEMWAGKSQLAMPFIQGTKNMEFSCSWKGTPKKGQQCQEFLPKYQLLDFSKVGI